MVEYLLGRAINVAILKMPDLPDLRSVNLPDPIEDYERYTHLVNRLAADADILLLDANRISWTQSDFADPHHLNGIGTRRLSEWVTLQLDDAFH